MQPFLRPKSPARLIAQAGEVASQLAHQPDRDYVLHYVANAGPEALQHIPDVLTRTVQHDEYVPGDQGINQRISPGSERHVMTRQEYVRALREARRDEERFYMIAGRAALLKQHQQFTQSQQEGYGSNHPPVLLGEGDTSRVEQLTHNMPVRQYARRQLKQQHAASIPPLADIDNHVIASLRTNEPLAERLQAVSYANGGETIAAAEAGSGIGDLSHEVLQRIKYFQLQDLVNAVGRVKHDAVQVDILQKPDNIQYDPIKGFTLLDLGVTTPDNASYALDTATTFMRIGHFLANGKTAHHRRLRIEDYDAVARELQDRLPVVAGFAAACAAAPAETFGPDGAIAQEQVVAACTYIVSTNQQKIVLYKDPSWVIDDITYNLRTGKIRGPRLY